MNHKKVDNKIFISIDKGELVNQKLLEVAEKENLKSGWINGLGAISDIEIGYWDIEKKVYVKQKFDSDYVAWEQQVNILKKVSEMKKGEGKND